MEDSTLQPVQRSLAAAARAAGPGDNFSVTATTGWATTPADGPSPKHRHPWRLAAGYGPIASTASLSPLSALSASPLPVGASFESRAPLYDFLASGGDSADSRSDGETSSSDDEDHSPAGETSPGGNAHMHAHSLGLRGNRGKSAIQRFGVEVPSLFKWEQDMVFEDLFAANGVHAHWEGGGGGAKLAAATLVQNGLFGKTARCHWQDCTEMHEICAAKVPADLDRHLGCGRSVSGSPWRKASAQIYQPNAVGQLPLHVAARTNRIFGRGAAQEDAEALPTKHQPGPELVATLVTGRSVKTGAELFVARKDQDGKDLSCLHQDSLGMTPLHAACRSDCRRAKLVVAILLEANPDAASVSDMDGLLPIDLAVRSRQPGAADIVKMLLRVQPTSAVVSTRDLDSLWQQAQRCVDPVREEFKHMDSFTDTALSTWFGGHDGLCEDLRFLQPWRILVQHMLAQIDSQYHVGNIPFRDSLLTLTRSNLRSRIKNDEVGSDRPEYAIGKKNRKRRSNASIDMVYSAKKTALKMRSMLNSRSRTDSNSNLDSTVASSISTQTQSTWAGQRRHSFLLGLQAMQQVKPLPAPKNSMIPAPFKPSSPSIRGIIADLFSLWDEDLSGTLSCTELERGFLSLSMPVDAQMIRTMILAVDQDGDEMLSEAEFAVLLDRFLNLPEMVCWTALQTRWEHDKAYLTMGVHKFHCEECRKNLDVKDVVRSFFSASMQDPAVLDSMLPYRANCIFNMTQHHIFDNQSLYGKHAERRITKKARQNADAAKLNNMKLAHRLDTINDHIYEFQRAPLHWACANSDNTRAASMIRDLLAANAAGARMQDHQGKLPLHIACANTSQSGVAIVNLLLDVYPEGAQALDADGNLPLHVCLLQNSSKYAQETVKRLLDAFPDAAYIPSGKTRNLAPIFREFPAEMAFTSIGPSSPEIVFRLLCESPEMFFMQDRLGCTLFHNFCFKIRKAAENLQTMDDAGSGMCSAQILDAMFCAAKMFHPDAIQRKDDNNALPLHYASQAVGGHSRYLLKRLIRHYAFAAVCQDKAGHTPLHLAVAGSGKHQIDLGKELVADAPAALMIPNHERQLPVHLAGAWRLRAVFTSNTLYNRITTAISAVLEVVLLASLFVLAARQYQEHGSAVCAQSAGVILFLRSILFTIQDWGDPVQLIAGVKSKRLGLLLIWTQLFVPILSVQQVADRLSGKDYTLLLWMRRMQMPLMILPIGVNCTSLALILQGRLEGLDAICLCCCIIILSIVGVEQDSYRIFHDRRLQWMRGAELFSTLVFRSVETSSRITTFSLLAVAYSAQGLGLALFLEVLLSMLVSGQLYVFATGPRASASLLRREIFDLVGVYHGFGEMLSGFHADSEHEILGTATISEAYLKLTTKLFVQVCVLAVSAQKLQSQPHLWVPLIAYNAAALVLQLVFLHFRVKLGRRREAGLIGLTDAISLDAWRIPLFEKNSVDFLRAINDELIVCRYAAGDHIFRKGELDGVMHLMVKGVGFIAPVSSKASQKFKWRKTSFTASATQLFRGGSPLPTSSPQRVLSHKTSSIVMNSDPESSADTSSFKQSLKNLTTASMKNILRTEHLNGVDKYWSTLIHIFKRRGFQRSTEIRSNFKSRIEGLLLLEGFTAGDSSLLTNTPNELDIIARCDCETKALSRQSLIKILQRFPHEAEAIKNKLGWDDWDMGPEPDNDLHPACIQRGLAYDLFDKLPGFIVLHMDFSNINFNADLEAIIGALRFELSTLIGLTGRRVRVSLRERMPVQLDFKLEIAKKISLDGVDQCESIQDVYDALQAAILASPLRLAGTTWVRRVCKVSLVADDEETAQPSRPWEEAHDDSGCV